MYMKKYILLLLIFASCSVTTPDVKAPEIIKLYQGTTTVPAMGFFEDLVKSDSSIPRILHTARFESVDVDFEKHNIIKIQNTGQAAWEVYTKTMELLLKYPNSKLEIHTQLFLKCFDYGKLLKSIPQDRIASIHLYDDGAGDYTGLYNMKLANKVEETLATDEKTWEEFFTGKSPTPGTLRYSLEKIYPGKVVHHMMRPEYLELAVHGNKLDPIRNRVKSVKKIDFENMAKTFTTEQKELYFDLVGFNQQEIQALYDKSPNPDFALTGTTTWGAGIADRDFYAQAQINMIKNLVLPAGDLHKYLEEKTYDFFFKLHPNGSDINDQIIAAFPDYERIPDAVGYEVLIVAGLIPEKTGGILSSLYFSLPKDKIAYLIYTGSREDALVQVMTELDIIVDAQLHSWDSLKDM